MTVLIVLLASTLRVIYASSYIEVYRRNQDMLAHHIQLFSLDTFALGIPLEHPDDAPPGDHEDAAFRLSTFYSVALNEQGDVLLLDNDSTSYTDAELIRIARRATETMGNGAAGSLLYRCGRKDDCIVVAFMDNTVLQESITTLFRYTVIFGLAALTVIFALACKAAEWIVRPLEESHIRQKQFISDAGHELKTPISVISANAEILTRQTESNQWIENIQHETERMNELIRQLLELARTEQLRPQLVPLDLSRLIAGEALPFDSVAYERSIMLACDIQENISVCGDRLQLAQLTSILLDNALRHSPAGSEILLQLRKENRYAALSVTNEGEPIPPEQQKLLFERFYRADEARNGNDRRYGLGLAIAKAIVNAHHGKIGVQCHAGRIEFKAEIPIL